MGSNNVDECSNRSVGTKDGLIELSAKSLLSLFPAYRQAGPRQANYFRKEQFILSSPSLKFFLLFILP
jgi:hypothetical protein